MSDVAIHADDEQMRADRELLRERWYAEGWYTERTMGDEMRAAAERDPDLPIIFHSAQRPAAATLGELNDRAHLVAANLQRLGVRRGDPIAIQVPNWLEGAVAFQAAMLCGAIVVPVIHIYGATEVSFILRQSRAKLLIVPDRWRTIDYLQRISELVDVPDLERIVVIGDDVPPGSTPWTELERRDVAAFDPPPVDADDVCLLVYTSGTTADPKGVQHTHNTLTAEVRSGRVLFPDLERVSIGMFPFGHIAGALTLGRMFVHHMKTVLIDSWDAHEAAELIERHRVEGSAGTPFHLQTLLDAADSDGRDISSLVRIGTGGASVPPSVVERYDARGICVVRQYGSSEHPTITSGSPDDSVRHRAHTDGRAVAGNEVRIVDEAGDELPAGEDGEIATRGPELFVGYRNPELDRGSFLPGGWFLTGDIGNVDADGYMTVTDRKKDIIIRGGENISSKEVEDVIARHAAVAEAAVIAIPDDRYGERVCAFVILRPGHHLALADLLVHFVACGVAKHKTPERLEIVDELPRTPSGKVKKFELRRQVATAGPGPAGRGAP